VPYTLNIDKEKVENYLASLEGISEDARQRIDKVYREYLANYSDEYLRDAPFAPGSSRFWFTYAMFDGDNSVFFRFIADGKDMRFNIVSVLYADCEVNPTNWPFDP